MDRIFFRSNRLKLLLTPFILMGIIFTAIVLTVIFGFRTLDEIASIPFERMAIGFIEALVVVFFYNYIIRKLNTSYPWKRNWFIRSLIDFVLAISIPIIVISLINLALYMGWIPEHEHDDKYKVMIFIMPLMISALLLVVVEMIVATEERTNLEMKLAKIEKDQINTKYSALKEQLDHHFLFNNLSVLSSLIYESTEKADKFIQDFAAIYRYVLSINKRDLVTVKEEIDFIATYLNLYKFRFEDGFFFKLKVDSDKCKYLIPPLTFQVLIENVFKHNILSRQNPLTIDIYSTEKEIIIRNNIQVKSDKVDSTQTGQQNLIDKFKLLNCETPQFKIEHDKYISQIPLIKPADD
ncbi:MAG: histidine kinase [Carboxylicivirga sp.]|nr:histidine kinase [Carboxylicivirga sp.]